MNVSRAVGFRFGANQFAIGGRVLFRFQRFGDMIRWLDDQPSSFFRRILYRLHLSGSDRPTRDEMREEKSKVEEVKRATRNFINRRRSSFVVDRRSV